MFPNITQSTDFAALGVQQTYRDDPGSEVLTTGFAVSFDAVSGAYIIDLPSAVPGKFYAETERNWEWAGYLAEPSYYVSVFKPSAVNPLVQLSYTTYADFWDYDYDDPETTGFVAFGIPTPAAGIPTSGSATMEAMGVGRTTDWGGIAGSATLQFDFGAGTLAGHFDPVLANGAISLGRYTFVNTLFGVGSSTFSGNFSHANPLLTGAFNGLFTGPNAQELMAQWTADYLNPFTQQEGRMYGIWVGKKCC